MLIVLSTEMQIFTILMMKWMRQSTCWVESRKLSNKKALSLLLLQPDSGLLFRSFSSEVKWQIYFRYRLTKIGQGAGGTFEHGRAPKKYIGVCSNKVLDSGVVGNT